MMTRFEAALKWLAQGVDLVPLQPGSKRIVQGFGAYMEHVTEKQAAFWFRDRPCNLGLVLGQGLVCFDFDDVKTYERACRKWAWVTRSYTERTRRGFHVFFNGQGQQSFERDGFEVLGLGSVVTVSPSIVKGFKYRVERALSISRIPDCFPLLSEKKVSTLSKENASLSGSDDTIGRIKSAYSVLSLAKVETHMTSKDGRWWHGKCPLHEDKHASFWVDTERNLWGCYACKIKGDVINLYARLHRISVNEAIKEMVKEL